MGSESLIIHQIPNIRGVSEGRGKIFDGETNEYRLSKQDPPVINTQSPMKEERYRLGMTSL